MSCSVAVFDKTSRVALGSSDEVGAVDKRALALSNPARARALKQLLVKVWVLINRVSDDIIASNGY